MTVWTAAFSKRAFASVIRAGDSSRYSLNLKSHRIQIIEQALAQTTQGPRLQNFNRTRIRDRHYVSYSDYETILILRALSRYVRRRFRITLPNRDALVRGVIQSLADSTPFYILKRDVSSFYESIHVPAMRRLYLPALRRLRP
jgi:hypothetical protein